MSIYDDDKINLYDENIEGIKMLLELVRDYEFEMRKLEWCATPQNGLDAFCIVARDAQGTPFMYAVYTVGDGMFVADMF